MDESKPVELVNETVTFIVDTDNDMRVIKICYARTFNLGEFNSEKLELEMLINENGIEKENPMDAFKAAKDIIVKSSVPYMKAEKAKKEDKSNPPS